MGNETEYFLISSKILAEFRECADNPDFWSNIWSESDFEKFLAKYKKGFLGNFKKIFKKYLPKDSVILEAGCGRGQFVTALHSLGYRVCGLEFSDDLVKKVKNTIPYNNIILGDVRYPPFRDESVGAYISLGVIEHYFEEDREKIIINAHQMLKKNGILLLSVPHFNAAFQKLAKKRFKILTKVNKDSQKNFYQLYFTKGAIEEIIRESGFNATEFFYYGPIYGAKRAYPIFLKSYKKSYIFRVVTNLISKWLPQIILKYFSHMIMIIAIKD